jgi:mono/diheme cytochrome c family protein
MGNNSKSLLAVASMALALAIMGGCGGGDDGADKPAVQLSASEVASGTTNTHTHTVSIPFSDLGTTAQVNYTSSSTSGHTHLIALSPQQVSDLIEGMRVIVTSTAASDGHTHTWEIMGGNILYESRCYNCHGNGKRGSSRMPGTSYTPLASQQAALANPAAAPLSTAPAVTPDTTPPTIPTLDGAALYTSNCSTCHGPLATTSKKGSSATQIKNAIATPSTGMGSLTTLTDAQIQAIADAIK